MNKELKKKMKETVSLMLLEHGGIKPPGEGPYQLTSGNYSPIYFDNRRLATPPADSLIITGYAMSVLKEIEEKRGKIGVIAGGETAGISIAKDLTRMAGKKFIYVRKEPKGHGAEAQVEGIVKPGEKVLLFEDLITSGGSKVNFINGLRRAKYKIEDCLVIFDREQKGEETLKEKNVNLHSLTNLAATLKVGKESGFLSEEEINEVQQYLRDPKSWHEDKGLEYQEQ